MIKFDGVVFSYGGNPILNDVSFTVGDNQKVGLVGVNGSGKSTLFKLVTGSETSSLGKVSIHGSIGYVPQEVKRDNNLESSKSVREYINPTGELYDFDLLKMLSGLELENIDLDTKPENFSGGQKTKLALARALIAQPDILLLDEPTNFMDVSGKRFVMEFLSKYPRTLILVSHDLELLDEDLDKILEIDKRTGKIEEYKGNYSKYKKLKEEREELLKRQVLVKKKHIKQMEESLEKLKKQRSKKGVRQRVVHARRLEKEKAELPELPKELRNIKINLPEPTRVGELPLKAESISKSFGDKVVVNNLSFAVRRGEKFLFLGPNGSGKSTVIKILLHRLEPDTGRVNDGFGLSVGYYSQEFETLDMTKKILDIVREQGQISEQSARSFLARFMFGNDKIGQNVGSLSGGEKTRLSIALLMLAKNNLLVLDEPTTYLDPVSVRIILEAIKSYKGTLILVSHVEDFVKEVAPDRALVMPDGVVKLWSDDLLDLVNEI